MGVRALLDTHVLIWALLSPDELSASARTLILDASTTLLVSSASAWEIATKHRLGRLPEAADVVHGYLEHLRTLGAQELPISSAHALLAGGMRHAHRDPFDRVLAAQSILEGVPLVTGDAAFGALPVTVVW